MRRQPCLDIRKPLPDDVDIELAPAAETLPFNVQYSTYYGDDVLVIPVMSLFQVQRHLERVWQFIPVCSNYLMENNFSRFGIESTVVDPGTFTFTPSQTPIHRHACVLDTTPAEKIGIKPYWFSTLAI